MFRKVTNADLLNRIVNLENKIDIVNTRINSQTLEGCCDCKTRETSVYLSLRDYLDEKFSEFGSSILEQVSENNAIQDISRHQLQKEIINIFHSKFENYKHEIMSNLQTIITNLSISNIQGDGNESFCTNYILDQLRNELTTYRVDTENDIGKILVMYENANKFVIEKLKDVVEKSETINTKMNSVDTKMNSVDTKMNSVDTKMNSVDTKMNSVDTKMNSVDTKMNSVDTKMNSVDTKIDSIYFENEIIKHQLKLEDEIRTAIGEVQSLSLIVTSAISQLDDLLKKGE
jgi:hypothetical protein